tara:strand:- start:288 stop:518 length:231 start_codon:yes stop_codon:yes gene_type:complete
MGCDDLRQHIIDTLGIDFGQTTEDGEFTLIPVPCLGDCDKAPVMMVGEKMQRKLTRDTIDEIVAEVRIQSKARTDV